MPFDEVCYQRIEDSENIPEAQLFERLNEADIIKLFDMFLDLVCNSVLAFWICSVLARRGGVSEELFESLQRCCEISQDVAENVCRECLQRMSAENVCRECLPISADISKNFPNEFIS